MIRSVDERPDKLQRLADAAGERTVPASGMRGDMVATAILAARGRAARRRQQRVAGGVLAVAAMVALGFALTWRPAPTPIAEDGAAPAAPREPTPAMPTPAATRAERLALTLPTGERLVRIGEGALELRELGPRREVALDAGEVLFDVPSMGAGEAFEVVTPHLRVEVVGTVFAVDVRDDRSAVEVFEGEVRVHREGEGTVPLRAGDRFDGNEVPAWRSRLGDEGRAAAERREALAAHVPTVASDQADRGVTPTGMQRVGAAREAASGTPPGAPTLDEVREWLSQGELERARSAATAAVRRQPRSGAWRMLLGDVQRVARDPRAADTYDEAAVRLSESRATQAGYLAAELRLGRGDAGGALRSLRAARAMERGSPIAERATVLGLRALQRAGRSAELQRVARDYLLRFPAGAERPWVEGLLRAP